MSDECLATPESGRKYRTRNNYEFRLSTSWDGKLFGSFLSSKGTLMIYYGKDGRPLDPNYRKIPDYDLVEELFNHEYVVTWSVINVSDLVKPGDCGITTDLWA